MKQSKVTTKATANDAAFLFKCSTHLLFEARSVAAENMMSLSAFIRQSMMLNLKNYRGR